jgi:hypothetical protein
MAEFIGYLVTKVAKKTLNAAAADSKENFMV